MSFLSPLTKESIETGEFPLTSILENSLYYPSAGFDGGVVRDCNTNARQLNIVSFIYCDYGIGEEKLENAKGTFKGYHVLGSRRLTPGELVPNGWQPQIPPRFDLSSYRKYSDHWKPFATWIVYERDEDQDDAHGPHRFSLLYIGGEGVATYQALYWTNNASAKALAIIQPGTGFGLNRTDFRAPEGALAWVVNENPTGIPPEYIYYGGRASGYDNFRWPSFEEERMIRPYYPNYQGEVRVLKRSVEGT